MASQRKTQSPKSMTRCISVLQRVAANIFVADCDLKIIYVNPKGQEMLLAIEAEMKKAWGIRADGILGERLSRFGQDAGDLLGIVHAPVGTAVHDRVHAGFGHVTGDDRPCE